MAMTFSPKEYFRVSHSSLSVLRTCARKFEFERFYSWPAYGQRESSVTADVGTALHAAYQTYLETGSVEEGLIALMQAYPIESNWSETDYRSFEAAFATYEAMVEETRFLDDYALAIVDEKPAVEVPFAIIFENAKLPDGRTLVFVGFIDLIMQHRKTGMFRPVDIKTHRSQNQDRTAQYQFNGQLIPYGLILELAQKKTIDRLDVTYLDAYVDVLEPRVTPYNFTKTEQDLQEWLLEFYIQMRELFFYAKNEFFPRTSHGCAGMFGSSCRFLEPCLTRDKEVAQAMILGGYEPEEQNPFDAKLVARIELPKEILL